MKTRLIQIATILLLLSGSGIAAAAEPARAPEPQASTPEAAQPAAESRDRLAWQRVGAPEESLG